MIDSLRADHVISDSHPDLTPFLAALANHGNVFQNAYAQSSWTMPAVASLWTSRYQSQHGVVVTTSALVETERTLASVLKEHGYITGGFSANGLLQKRLGFGQGFDRYDVYRESEAPPPHSGWRKEPGEHLNQRSLAWLDAVSTEHRAGAPVFLYLQYMEPHFPYEPPEEIFNRFLSRRPNAEQARQAYGDMLFVHRERWEHPDPLALQVIEDLYAGEVLSCDQTIRALFAELERRELLKNAIVVITADHGEELLDHGDVGHGKTLYNEVIQIPLLILASNQRERVNIHDLASLVDVAPTVLDLAGISPPPSFEGHSLRPAMHQVPVTQRALGILRNLLQRSDVRDTAYSELSKLADPQHTEAPRHLQSVVAGTHKLIVGADGSKEAYDLASDPHETTPGALTSSDRAALDEALRVAEQRAARHVSNAHTAPLDEQTRERLRALGYAD